MGSKIISRWGLGSLSPNYHVDNKKFPNKIITIIPHGEEYEAKETFENNIETKILVYEDRAKGWFLDFAKKLATEENSEFIVLMICMNYLEGNQQFREGKSSKESSTKTLKRALERIFPDTEESNLDYFIDKVRHGLFHDGMTKRGALLRYGLNVPFFTFNMNGEDWMEIEPALFLKRLEEDLEDYIKLLKNKNNKTERTNFEEHYKERYEKTPDA